MDLENNKHDHSLEEEIVLFVDGRLDRERTQMLEQRAASDSELAKQIALVRQGKSQLLEAAAVEAPFELRRRIDEQLSRPQRSSGWWRPFAAVAAAGAAAGIAIALVTTGPTTPDYEQVVAVSSAPPVTPVESAGGGKPLLTTEVEGVQFPDYAKKFGWKAVGSREEELEGRSVTTVTYQKQGKRVDYSIVSGEALPWPGGKKLESDGTKLESFGSPNLVAVTWRRQGHTCVLSGSKGVTEAEAAELAGWRAKGAISA